MFRDPTRARSWCGVPVAALVGIAATSISAGLRSPALRALPAVVLSVAMVLWGSPLWDAGGEGYVWRSDGQAVHVRCSAKTPE